MGANKVEVFIRVLQKLRAERARQWLRKHRLDGVEPTALVMARLDARQRGLRAEIITVLLGTVALLVWSVIDHRRRSPAGPDGTDPNSLVWLIATYVILILGMLAGLGYRRRLERPLLASRRTRSAHPAAAGVAQVLGRGQVAMAVVVYGGGLLLGAAVVVLAPRPPDRTLALVFLGGIGVVAALAVVTLTAVLRRPALAEDSESLLVDDLLRAEDARRAVVPYPAIVGLVVGLNSTVDSWLIWTFLGYFGIGLVSWLLAERSVRCAPRAEKVARP
jgi:hypothetical protein